MLQKLYRKKLSREQKTPVSHRESMRVASTTWPDIKTKLQKKLKHTEKKRIQDLGKTQKNIKKT